MEPFVVIDVASEPGVEYTDQEIPIPINIFVDTPTLENTLCCLGMSDALHNLDKCLEDVKTNKIQKKDHAEFSKSTDKLIQNLSLKHHPDRFQRGSDLQKARAHEMQSALNVTRTVLRTLTEEFLENIDIDYKYAYFAQLDVRSLVNRSEIDSQLRDVLYKICELSEIKRVHIIGEIRKFLVESRHCLKSYFENPHDFIKYRDYALFHLKKCIGGYSALVKECEALEKECKLEREENMRRIIHEIKKQSSREFQILVALRYTAKDSVKSNFQIFSINQYMNEYFILPFVYYVNVLLMCNATVEKKKFLNFTHVDPLANPYFEIKPTLFADAYHLAVHLYDRKQCVDAVERIMKEKYPEENWERNEKERIKIPESRVRNKFNIVLKDIMDVLEKKFRTDAYIEGKTNREKLNERLETLKKVMADLKEKEKCLRENISVRQKENQEIRKECEKIMVKNEKAQKEMRENLKHSDKPSERFLLKSEENTVENSGVSQNYNEENKTEIEEVQGEKLHKTVNQQITDLLSDLQRNSAENKTHLKQENAGNYDPTEDKDVEEILQKIKMSLKESKTIQRELSGLLLNCVQNMTEHSGIFGNKSQENLNKLQLVLKDSEQMKRRIQESRDLVKQLLKN